MSVQRLNKTLSQERRKRLDELGFVWDLREAAWEDRLLPSKTLLRNAKGTATFLSTIKKRLCPWSVG